MTHRPILISSVIVAAFGLLTLTSCGPDYGDMRGYMLLSERIVEADTSFILSVQLKRTRSTILAEESVIVTDAVVTVNSDPVPFNPAKSAYQIALNRDDAVLWLGIEDGSESFDPAIDIELYRIAPVGFPESDADVAGRQLELQWARPVQTGPAYLEVFRNDRAFGELVQGLSPLTYTIPNAVNGEITVYYSYRDNLNAPPPFEEVTYHYSRQAEFILPE